MITLILTAAFGVLGAFSIYFAHRDEEGRTFFWVMATLCALAFGFSLGSSNQDAQLKNEITALTARLQTGQNPAGANPPETVLDDTDTVADNAPDSPLQAASGSASPTVPSPATAAPTAAPSDTEPPVTEPPVIQSSAPKPDVPRSAETEPAVPTLANVPSESTPEARLPEPQPAAVLPVANTEARLSELVGTWEMTTTIERTAYPAYAGLELTFRLGVTASGATFGASGNKTAERAPGAARTLTYAPSAANRIALTGAYVDTDTLALSFEEGVEGQGGTMTLNVVSPQRLEGVFLSSSAASGGSVVWRKLSGSGTD